jgi:hypothetical protein
VLSAGFSPDGARIVTASTDNTALLWDAASGCQIEKLAGHKGWVRSATFSPTGTSIITASDDHSARLWKSGKPGPNEIGEETMLVGHDRPLFSAAFTPDGARVGTASWDGTARLWEVGAIPKSPIPLILCKLLNGNYSLEGLTAYPLTFERPICATDPPPP